MNAKDMDIQRVAVIDALMDVAKQNNGVLNVDAAVEVAKDPTNILHSYLEWDDSVAGHEYRRAQMSGLIRRVKFHLIREEKDSKTVQFETVRAFQSRPSQRTRNRDEGGYETVDEIMAEDFKRQEMLEAALKELESFERRYSELSELANLFKAIRLVKGKLDIKPKDIAI